MESYQNFQKIHKIYSVEVNSFEDLVTLADRILNDSEHLVSRLRSSENPDSELADDLMRLIEGIKEGCVKEESEKYKDLVYLVVSNWLGHKSVTLFSFLVNRLYKRGFTSVLVDSFLKNCYESVETGRTEDFVELCVSERSDSTLLMCCNALRYLSKFIYVEYYEGQHYMCIDSYRNYNLVRRTIGVMFGSHLRWQGNCDHRALSNLFHPFSRIYLPCLVLYTIIDLLEDETKGKLLEILSFYYADTELMRIIQVNQVASLSGCLCRLFNSTKVPQGFDFQGLSKSLTKAITNGFTTLDPVIRLSALKVAETYSEFLYNNSQIKDDSLKFKYERELELDSPITFEIAVCKSTLTINPNFSKIKEKSPKVEKNDGNEKQNEENLVKDDNEEFIEYIFQGVPKVKFKTVDGYVKNSWLRPPQHIVQCFERMLSKPARGDIDYECLNKHELDRIESEKVEEKILRISQTLLYLPKVIEKKETILQKYAIPLTNILLKLDDLDLYREKMEEIVEKSRNQVLVQESGLEELANPTEFVSKDPQILILLSLVLITYHCPAEMTKFHSSHLFDREYSLSMRITMLLCVQYTAIAFNAGLDKDSLTKKVVEDTENMTNKNQTISTFQTCNPITDYDRECEITLLSNQKVSSEGSGSTGLSTVFTRNFNNIATSLLLDSLSTYSKNHNCLAGAIEEDIVVGIFETLIIFITSGSIRGEILRELKEMTDYFESLPRGRRFKNTLEVLSMMLSTVQHTH